MKKFRENIWKDDEYSYEAAYGFIPNIHAYLHDEDENDDSGDKNRDCMLVIPGGGYCMCCQHEGELPAKVFYEQGMNTFVLTYTTDITMSVPLKKQPLNDISRAVRFIRKNAKEYGVEGKKLIICGFSAGGHVCGSLAVHFDDVKDPDPGYDCISNRPDGAILSYPVLTSGKFTHEYSILALVGADAGQDEKDYFSCEKHVTVNTPPCFLWQTVTDGLVPIENTYLFAQALLEKKIPFAHYAFPSGFHGLTVCNEESLNGWKGEDYCMEQVMLAVNAVKDGKGVRVSEKRRAELIEQFFPKNPAPAFEWKPDMSLLDDVGCWTKMAKVWIERL